MLFKNIIFNNPLRYNFINRTKLDSKSLSKMEAYTHSTDVPSNGILVVDSTGTIIDFNLPKNLTTVSKEDILGINLEDVLKKLKTVKELKKVLFETTKNLETILQKDKENTEFMANLSHELRTPLNIIFSSIQLNNLYLDKLPKSTITENIRKHTRITKQNCYRLLRLINNLIDSNKLDGGFLELNMQNCNIVNIIENITLSVKDYVNSKGLNLVFDTNVEEKYIYCDPDAFERIMLNLLSNAIKHSYAGNDIIVYIDATDTNIFISVEDFGFGIPEDKQSTIFQRFKQGNFNLLKDKEGSGLGLFLVKSLVELHNGNISLSSTYGKGSKFIIELPITNYEYAPHYELETDMHVRSNFIEKINIEFSDIYL